MHRIDLTPIYVLHTRPFRNTSLLVDVFSKEHGRISVVAQNARGVKSRYRGQLQLFTPMLASWSGRHELKALGQVELSGSPITLNQQPLFCGFYLNELLVRLLHKEDPHPALFDYYHAALCCLAKNDAIPAVLRHFEKKLLEDLGYALPLSFEAKTHEAITGDAVYHFVPNQGFHRAMPGEPCEPFALFSGKDLLGIAAEQFDDESVLISAKRLMRSALSVLLGNQPLHSRELF